MAEPDSERDPVEVLAAEFVERQRRGEHPSVAEYVADHPDLADEIRELFPTIAAVERLKVDRQRSSDGRASLGGVQLDRLGDFRIIREIGRGGMGIVFEAEQESLGRRVAVKVLPQQALLEPKHLLRFQREAKTAAKLHHTNIVPVFGVGQQDNYHYLVMQLIRGVGLDEILGRLERVDDGDATKTMAGGVERPYPGSRRTSEVESVARALLGERTGRVRRSGSSAAGEDTIATTRGVTDASTHQSQSASRDSHGESDGAGDDVLSDGSGLPPESEPPPMAPRPLLPAGPRYWRSVADIGMQVGDALEYAHAQGTIHRDVKPANLLIDFKGVAWITDFGLAKAMEHDGVSKAGNVVGTLRYMAPEQLHGEADARSDVYSLGASLYELLTLRPVYQDADRSNLIRRITQEEPTPPRKINPEIPRDLETVVLKAIARDPAHRYQSAREAVADLRRFLEDRPIEARRASGPERLWRWCRRNRAVAGLTGTALMLLMLVAVVASVGYVRTKRAEAQVRDALAGESRQRQRAEATSELALEAVDAIFEEFTPKRLMSMSELTIESADGEEIDVPTEPVVSRETASLLEQMLVFYDRLAEHGGDDAEMRQRTAAANCRIGDIHQRLGEYQEARAAYSRALDAYEELLAEKRGDRELELKIIDIHLELATMSWAAGEPEEGRDSCFDALTILEAASPEQRAAPEYRYALARSNFLLARGERSAGPNPPGSARQGLGLRPGRDGRGPQPPPGERKPEGRDPRPQPKGAGGGPGHPIELLEKLVADYPSVPEYRHLLAQCYREMPPPLPRGDRRRDFDGIGRATEILQQLVEDFPGVPDYRHDLSETYASLDFGGPIVSQEDLITATERLRKALAISEELVAERPNVPDYLVSQVHIRHKLADVLRRSGEFETAETELRQALALQTALSERFPGVAPYRIWLATIQGSLARLLRDRDRLEEARALLETSVAALDDLLTDEPRNPHVRGVLAESYECLADVLSRLGEVELAQQTRRKARRTDGPEDARERPTGLLLNEPGAFEGYTLFAPLRSSTTYLVDMQGRVVHTWDSEYEPGQSVYLLDSGELLRCARERENPVFHGGGIGGRVQRIDWDGNVTWDYVYSDESHCQHHDIAPMPNGNVLMIAWEAKTEEEAIAAGRDPALLQGGGLWPDHIIEVEPDGPTGGRIVWEWHVWDHLTQEYDKTKDNYGVVADHPELIDVNFGARRAPPVPEEIRRLRSLGYIGGAPAHDRRGEQLDWNHTNAIAYNARLDQIVLTVRVFSELWVIDHSTTTEKAKGHSGGDSGMGGDLLYRWGNPQAYRAGTAADQRLFGPHDAHSIAPELPGEGHLLIFNNGAGRPDGDYSSVLEIVPPVGADGRYVLESASGYGPADALWRYTSAAKPEFFSGHISGAQRLPNGNTLVCSGEDGRLFESDADGKIVWEYVNPFGEAGPARMPPIGGPPGVPPGGPPPAPAGLGQPPRPDRPGDDMRRPQGPLRGGRPRPGPGDHSAVFRAVRYAPGYPGLRGRHLEPVE